MTRIRSTWLGAAVVAGLMSVGLSGQAGFTVGKAPTHTFAVVKSTMVGGNEVPRVGDPKATGLSRITLDSKSGRVCYVMAVFGLHPDASAAHIHVGTTGIAGKVVIQLKPPTPAAFGCAMADPLTVQAIIDNPAGFYTNVHNAPFAGGAIRGQLELIARR